jgi:hypothetical protein
MKYYRIQADYLSQFTGKPIGIFGAVFGLIKRGIASEEDVATYEKVLAWFEANLRDPEFYEQGNPIQGITWFKESAKHMLGELRPLTDILDKHRVAYELVETSSPGAIIYQDEHQIGTL